MIQIIPIRCDEEVAVVGLAAFVLRAFAFLDPHFVYVIRCIRDFVVTLAGVPWKMTLNCKLCETGSRCDNYRGPERGSREDMFRDLQLYKQPTRCNNNNFINNFNQLNMFRAIISPILRSTRLCLQLVV